MTLVYVVAVYTICMWWLYIQSVCGGCIYNLYVDANVMLARFVCLFVFGATVPSGPAPPHSRDF